jgi:hypothetical protein
MYERLHTTIKTKFLLPHTYVILVDFEKNKQTKYFIYLFIDIINKNVDIKLSVLEAFLE